MKKRAKTILTILLVLLLLSIYPVYAIIVWNDTKSPSDFSQFPINGVWVCQTDDFTMTIDLDGEAEEDTDNALGAQNITINFSDKTYHLDCSVTSGHGTILAPVHPSKTITFKTKGELAEENSNDYIHFSVSKYKFEKNEFDLIKINVRDDNKVSFLTKKMTLHFVREEI